MTRGGCRSPQGRTWRFSIVAKPAEYGVAGIRLAWFMGAGVVATSEKRQIFAYGAAVCVPPTSQPETRNPKLETRNDKRETRRKPPEKKLKKFFKKPLDGGFALGYHCAVFGKGKSRVRIFFASSKATKPLKIKGRIVQGITITVMIG